MLNISLENDPLHMEEHRSRVLEIEGDDAFSARTYLAFLTPLGKRAVSEDLVLTGGRCVYPLSSALLDGAGPLFVQLVAEDDDGRVKKSDVYEFAVSPSLSDGELTAEGGLVCLKDVAADVREILSLLPGFAKKSDLPAVPSAVSAFVNDVPYLTPADLPAVPSAVSAFVNDVPYLTPADLPALPAISTDIAADAASDTKTASPKAVKTFVEEKGYQTAAQVSAAIPTNVSAFVNDAGYLHDTAGEPVAAFDIANAMGQISGRSPTAYDMYLPWSEAGGQAVNTEAFWSAIVAAALDGEALSYIDASGNALALDYDPSGAYPYFSHNADIDGVPLDPTKPFVWIAKTDNEPPDLGFILFEDRTNDTVEIAVAGTSYATEDFVLEGEEIIQKDVLGGLNFRKAYSAYPTTPQDGDIVCIDGNYDVYYTGDGWEPMTPDPDTVYFIVEG